MVQAAYAIVGWFAGRVLYSVGRVHGMMSLVQTMCLDSHSITFSFTPASDNSNNYQVPLLRTGGVERRLSVENLKG